MVGMAEYHETDALHSKMPKRRGTIDDLNKFDAVCFRVNTKQAEKMSPESRILLEVATEAILDAGINPVSMRGAFCIIYIEITVHLTHTCNELYRFKHRCVFVAVNVRFNVYRSI